MPEISPLIRLFVSSTFADFAFEREVLKRAVFPRLRSLCAGHGYRFQPIDLRWGVSEAAGNEKRTLAICLEEIARCQRLSPDLNLLILLGDRYGSCFLPEHIPSEHVERLTPYLHAAMTERFAAAYREDLNALRPEYVLLPTLADSDARQREETLRMALAQAATLAGFSEQDLLPFVASATHLEIQRGLLDAECDPSATICTIRSLSSAPEPASVADYVEQRPEQYARLQVLKRAVEDRLGEERIWRYSMSGSFARSDLGQAARLRDKEPSNPRYQDIFLQYDRLAEQFVALLEPQIRAALERRQAASTTRNPTAEANRAFAEARAAVFEGRNAELEVIATYLAMEAPTPLVVSGVAGVGKSALLARAGENAAQTHPSAVIVTRYIGVTPGTSSLADLLSGLRREIAERYDLPQPEPIGDLSQLVAAFANDFGTLEVSAEHPLILFLDALDQLGPQTQRMDWLPRRLAPHVRLVVSVLSTREELAELRSWLPAAQVIILGPLDRAMGQQSLRRWLAEDARTLTLAQETAVLDAFEAADGSPLYLRVAEEAARHWGSDAPIPALPVTTPALLAMRLDALEEPAQFGEALVRHALGDLAAARDGLVEDELLDILARDAQVRDHLHLLAPDSPPIEADLPLPAVLWARLYAELERLLTEQELGGVPLLTFYHGQVRSVVAARCLQGDDARSRHHDLASFFGEQDWGLAPDVWNRRKLAELVPQQAGAEISTPLRETLTDARYLEGKLAIEGAYAALEDLARLEGDPAVRHITWVFRGWAGFLEAHPEDVANQVEGRRTGERTLHHSPGDRGRAERPALRLLYPTLWGDPALVRRFTGHTGEVIACVLSPDSRFVVSAADDGTVRWWDVPSGQEVRRVKGYDGEVTHCALSADGSRALYAGGSDDRTVRVWDVESGKEVLRFRGHAASVSRCALSADGRLALSSSKDESLQLWDTTSGRVVQKFPNPMTPAAFRAGCALSADGRFVVYGADGLLPRIGILRNGSILRLWDVASGQEIHRLKGHSDTVNACVLSADNRYILSASDDRTVRLWDVASGQEVRRFKGHTDGVFDCALSADNRFALSVSNDQTTRVWDVASGREIRRLEWRRKIEAYRSARYDVRAQCALSADGSLALADGGNGTLALWDLASASEQRRIERHDGPVVRCALSADGSRALSASRDRMLRLWDVASGQEIQKFEGHTEGVTACALSANGRRVLSASNDRTLRLWDAASGKEVRRFKGHKHLYGCALSADGSRALWAVPGRKEVERLSNGVKFREVTYWDVLLWDVPRGRVLQRFTGHTGNLNACVLSADGSRVLSASADRTVRLWDVASGQEIHRFDRHWNSVTACALSADGTRALSAGLDWTVRLWDGESGRQLHCLEHKDPVYACALSADGSRAVSVPEDGTVRLWSMESGEELTNWHIEYWPRCCALSADGYYVVVGDDYGSFHFLEVVGLPPTSDPHTAPPSMSVPNPGTPTVGYPNT